MQLPISDIVYSLQQPEICKWNCGKFAEALRPLLPLERSMEIVNETYDKEFKLSYLTMMRKKFGLFKALDQDVELIDDFLHTMQATGADFTNSFRALSMATLPGMIAFERDLEQVHEKLCSNCCTVDELIKSTEATVDSRQVQLVLMLLSSNPEVLQRLGFEPEMLRAMLDKVERLKELKERPPQDKKENDRKLWKEWLHKYEQRLKVEAEAASADDQDKLFDLNAARVKMMNEVNPRFVLRNYLAQQAIAKAEKGDYARITARS